MIQKSSARKHRAAKPQPEAVRGTSSLRDEHRRVTRARLINAAEELFRSQGFRATTVDNIAKHAGTTVTTFYRYFESKSDLFHILQGQLSVDIDRILAKLAQIPDPGRGDIRAWLNAYYRMWVRVHALCDAYWEAVGSDDGVAAGVLPETLRLSQQLEHLIRTDDPVDMERAHMRLAIIILTLDRVSLLVQGTQSTPEKSEVLDIYADVVWQAIQPAGSAPSAHRSKKRPLR